MSGEAPVRNVTAIVAAAGGAPDAQPSWTLVLPDGRPAIASVIERLDCRHVARFVFVCLRAHAAEYFCPVAAAAAPSSSSPVGACEDHLRELIASMNPHLRHGAVVEVLMLDRPTGSAVETVTTTIAACGITGPLFVKDADGAFDFRIPPGWNKDVAGEADAGASTGTTTVVGASYCVAMTIHDDNVHTLSDLTRKSFVQECGGMLTNIVEKKIISDKICVGGYGFESAAVYVETAAQLAQVKDTFFAASAGRRPLFNSDILLSMMAQDQHVVQCHLVQSFDDWKSPAGVVKYARSFQNVVVSLEDELCERVKGNIFRAIELSAPPSASSSSSSADEQLRLLFRMKRDVADDLRQRKQMGRCKIVVLTALPAHHREAIERFLAESGVPFDAVVCGMFTGGRSP